MLLAKASVLALALSAKVFATVTTKIVCASESGTEPASSVHTKTVTKAEAVVEVINLVKKKDTVVVEEPTTKTLTTTSFTTITATAATDTDTATVTRSATQTDTKTSTITDTSVTQTTSTSTSSSTSTVATVPGFVPIKQDNDYVAKRSLHHLKGHLARSHPKSKSKVKSKVKTLYQLSGGKSGIVVTPRQYLHQVICEKRIIKTNKETVTKTVPGKTFTRGRVTRLSTATKTLTQTSVVYPAHVTATETESTTITVTTTQVVHTTTTTTETETDTVTVAAATTAYAACSDNNIAKAANSGHAIGVVFSDDNYVTPDTSQGDTNTPQGCCIACQNTGFCSGFVSNSGTCLLFVAEACHAGEAYSYFQTDPKSTSFAKYIGNGPCGLIENFGDRAQPTQVPTDV